MCASFFTLISRIFRSFILFTYFWTTLYQTCAFAEIDRLSTYGAIPVRIKNHDYLYYSIAVGQNEDDKNLKASTSSDYPSTPSNSKLQGIYIPLACTSTQQIQEFFNKVYVGTVYQNLTILDTGLSWNSFGIDFYFDIDTRELQLCNTKSNLTTKKLNVTNDHGKVSIQKDLELNQLQIQAKSLLTTATLNIENLRLDVLEKSVNSGNLTIKDLVFKNEENASVFLNQEEGILNFKDKGSIKGKGGFVNKSKLQLQGNLFLENSKTENNGIVTGSHITIKKTCAFRNNGELVSDTPLTLDGKGAFIQNGSFSTKKARVDTHTFTQMSALTTPQLSLTIGNHVFQQFCGNLGRLRP